jgi:hypothetical protein
LALAALVVWFCLINTANANFTLSIDNSGDVGKYVSMVMTPAGTPIIAYYDDSGDDLKISLCADALCETVTTVMLDTANDVGKYASVALSANGFPAVAYLDDTLDNLKLALCNDALCSGVTIRTLDEVGVVGEYVSMARGSDGFLVGAYYDRTNSSLKAFHCTNVACDSPEFIPMTTVGGAGTWVSLKISPDTFPMISFYDGMTGDLRLADCSSIGCSTVTYLTLDSTDNVGAFSTLGFLPSTRPVVAYYDATNARLKVLECLNLDCSNKSIVMVDALNTVGQYPSMVIGSDGFPLIAYHDVTFGDLKFADCANSDCSSRTITVIEESAGVYSSLAQDGAGNAAVAYYHSVNTALYLVRLQNYAPQFNSLTDPVGVPAQVLSFTVSATDRDNSPLQTLTYSMVGQVPTGATLNPSSGLFTWTPTGEQLGTHVLVFFVRDNGLPSLFDDMTVIITINDNNAPPVLNPLGDIVFNEGVPNSITLTGSDSDVGQILSYGMTGLPASAVLDPVSAVLTWTPSPTEIGFYAVTFMVSDSGANVLTDSETVMLQVRDQLVVNPTLEGDVNNDKSPDGWQLVNVPKSWYRCRDGNCAYYAEYAASGALRQNLDVRWLDSGDTLTARATLRPRRISAQEVLVVQVFYPDKTKAKMVISALGSLPVSDLFEAPPLVLTQRPYKVQVRVQIRKRTGGGKLIADDIYVFAESARADPTRIGAVLLTLPTLPATWRTEGGH